LTTLTYPATPLYGFPACSVAFDPDAHRYAVQTPIGDFRHPSVTTILKVLGKGDALVDWGARTALERVKELAKAEPGPITKDALEGICSLAEASWRQTRTEAASIGTCVHEALQMALEGKPWDYPLTCQPGWGKLPGER
jgi:hypothetical protein